VQCLYCETQLKGLRGFFDEDFCCREHREKYFSSFRKAFDQMPAHQYVVAGGKDAPPAPLSAVSTLETVATPPHAASNDPDMFVRVFQLVSAAAGESDLTATRVAEFTPLNLFASDMPAARFHCAFEPRLQLGLPVLAERSHSVTLQLANDCELSLECRSIDSQPAAALQFATMLPIELPGFAAAPEALEIETEDEAAAGQQISAERHDELPVAGDLSPQTAALHQQVIPEIAPPMVFHSSAAGATSLRVSKDSDEKTSALVSPASPLTLPGFASILEPVAPAAAAEMVSGGSLEPAPADAAVPAAEQDTGKPLRLTFGSLVRIKNWRLRITFARSA